MKEKMDYWSMLFQLAMNTQFSEDYLMSLSPDDIEKLYQERIEQHGEITKN